MAKNFQLQIDDPCHENWDKMTPMGKGRFCGSCQKQVVDFTRMSDSQIAIFFKKPSTGSVCGRFMSDQLNKDIEIPRKRIPWIKYFFQFALPAFLMSQRASAQGMVRMVKGDTTAVVCSKDPVQERLSELVGKPAYRPVETEQLIKDRVMDNNGDPMEYVTVMVKGESKIATMTDKQGNFLLKVKDGKPNIVLVASYVGYSVQDMTYDPKQESIVFKLEPDNMLDVVVFTGMISVKRSEEPPLMAPLSEDESRRITAYPNPATSGSAIILTTKKLKEGEYILRFINQSGQTVHTIQTRIGKNSTTTTIQLPFLKTGHYILSIENKKLKESFSEKLVIQ